MPELPEVETTRRGIAPHLEGATIRRLTVRNRNLRWPIPSGLERKLRGEPIHSVARRGKYLLLITDCGGLLLHLGMSGSLRILDRSIDPGPHDHFDLETAHGKVLRYRDPRRFGCLLWQAGEVYAHPLLAKLGVEPLSGEFDGAALWRQGHRRRSGIKNIIMNARVVVGVGNIYASEALHGAGIHPQRRGDRISVERYRRLALAIQETLRQAIERGGTTLRDFTSADGNPGYFSQQLMVYDRAGHSCYRCQRPVRRIVTGQRATYYCPGCQH
jgi:formamidopyrimidine-DNA glycosylase